MNFTAMPLVAQPFGQRGDVVETRTQMTTQMQQTMEMQIRITMQPSNEADAVRVMAQATAEVVGVDERALFAHAKTATANHPVPSHRGGVAHGGLRHRRQ